MWYLRCASRMGIARGSRNRWASGKSSCMVVDNPYDGETVFEVPLHNQTDMLKIVDDAHTAFQGWRQSSLDERIDLCYRFLSEFESRGDEFAKELSLQMGKPLSQAKGEVATAIFRSRTVIDMAPSCLARHHLDTVDGITRWIDREPIGTVLTLSPWNYPLVCAVGSLIPAILAGNSCILKHSDRSPLCAETFSKSFEAAGAPYGLVSVLHASHELVAETINHPAISYVAFTGSVSGGHKVYEAAAKRFIDAGLELGGKDAAYISNDVDLDSAVAGVVDGACYNAGQSCCSVERAYVHADVHDEFVEKAMKEMNDNYTLGNPLDEGTTLGPMAQPHSIAFLTDQISHAQSLGAKALTGGSGATDDKGLGRFFLPSLVVNCNHDMSLMTEESFGPVLGVMKVTSDDEAISLMNDSAYGLSGSVWTRDDDRAEALCRQIDAGTVFQNRCDYLDPELPWSGRKDSGKGISLSHLGFNSVTRTKSFNLRR